MGSIGPDDVLTLRRDGACAMRVKRGSSTEMCLTFYVQRGWFLALAFFVANVPADSQYVANQTCTYNVSDPPTNYSSWTRDDCSSLVRELVEDEDGNPLFGVSSNPDTRMRNCCPLAQEFFRCFATSNWSTYDPPNAVQTMTSISRSGCYGFFEEQIALKNLGYNLDCPVPPPPYCYPVQNCFEENSPRNFTDASGVVIAGPWPFTEMDSFGSISCASDEGPLAGSYSGIIQAFCDNGTIQATNQSCVPNPCSLNGGDLEAGTDASGIELWGPWPVVQDGYYSYLECHPCVQERNRSR